MNRRIFFCILAVYFSLFLVLIGCGNDDPVTPDPSAPGSIIINSDPDTLDAPWVLAGPDSYSKTGNGDQLLTGISAGVYILVWGDVANFFTPSSGSLRLAPEGTITFSGTYTEVPVSVQSFILIPPLVVSMPTAFTMGSTLGGNETSHLVTLTGRFNMTSTEVTNAQYVAALQWAFIQGHVTVTPEGVRDNLDGSTSELLALGLYTSQISFDTGIFSTSYPNRPVGDVSWFGAAAYCDWMSLQDGLARAYNHSNWSCNSGNPYLAAGYRLPTEAEWELACRSGTTTPFNTGDCLDAGTEANYHGGYPYNDCPAGPDLDENADVRSYPPNQWGLFEMHGNVWEWCNDWYESYHGDEIDPDGAASGIRRILRGGGWNTNAASCRSAIRYSKGPGFVYNNFGFRIVRSIP